MNGERTEFVTWHWIAGLLISLLIAAIGYFSHSVQSELANFRVSVEKLNRTMGQLKEQIAVNGERYASISLRLNETRDTLQRLSDRVYKLETKQINP